MFGRRIHRNQFEGLIAFRDELMLCPSGYNDNVARFYFLVFTCDSRKTPTGCKEENLIDGVDLEVH